MVVAVVVRPDGADESVPKPQTATWTLRNVTFLPPSGAPSATVSIRKGTQRQGRISGGKARAQNP